MFKRTVELDLSCTPEHAFRHIALEFFDNHPRWDPDIVDLTKTSDGAIGPGTTGREVRVMDGRRFVNEFRITEFHAHDTFAHRTTRGAMAEDVAYAIVPSGSGSKLKLSLHIYPRNPLLWLLAPVIRPRIERNFNVNVARFVRLVNGESSAELAAGSAS